MEEKKNTVETSQRKRQKKQQVYLPREIIFNILTHHSAGFLQEHGKNICQTWTDLLNSQSFIEAHLVQSNRGLFIQDLHDLYDIKFLEVNKGKFTLTSEMLNFASNLLETSHGISLFRKAKTCNIYFVANLVTKQFMDLPIAPTENVKDVTANIGRVHLQKEFKVICSSAEKDGTYYWLVLTIGKDREWRKVAINHPQMAAVSFSDRRWISAAGAIYGVFKLRGTSKLIIAVDLSDETTWPVDVPNNIEEELGGFVELSNKLMYVTPGRTEEMLNVYRLEDFRRSEWTKVYKLDLEASVHKLIVFGIPMGWVDDDKVLIFLCPRVSSSQRIVAYNVSTKNCRILKRIEQGYEIIPITKSLVVPPMNSISNRSNDQGDGRRD